MTPPAPLIDDRTHDDILRQVRNLLATYVPEIGVIPPEGSAVALTRIFARYCEHVIDRLNQVPTRNFLAFVDLLGASPLPQQAARTPIAIRLVPGTRAPVKIPAGTQIGGPPADDGQPVVFETERDLVAVPLMMDRIFVRDPSSDSFADISGVLQDSPPDALPAFRGDRPIEHALFLSHCHLLGLSDISTLQIHVEIPERASARTRFCTWEIFDGVGGVPITPTEDSTEGLTRSGRVAFTDLPALSEQVVGGHSGRWLRCRLVPGSSAVGRTDMSRPDRSAVMTGLKLKVNKVVRNASIETAFANQAQLDLSKEVFPFGEKPRFGDALYMAHSDAFANARTRVTVHVDITNPSVKTPGEAEPPIPRTNSRGMPELRWEVWDGREWFDLGRAESQDDAHDDATGFIDTTRAFTKTGYVSFTLPERTGRTVVNGSENSWIRVRIISGNYGTEASYVIRDPSARKPEYEFMPATYAPPSIRSLSIGYTFESELAFPEKILTYDDFILRDVSPDAQGLQPFTVFQPPQGSPGMYVGLDLPPQVAGFPPGPVSIYFQVESRPTGTAMDVSSENAQSVTWQYWNSDRWVTLTVSDGTCGLGCSGILEFLSPRDMCRCVAFGLNRFWIRAQIEAGSHLDARVNRIVLNTTMASQAVTIRNEVVGRGKGLENQQLRTAHAPVLEGPELEILERGTWTRWSEVRNFRGSGADDKHYVLDHNSGVIRFGDGRRGRIPVSDDVVRMSSYRTGGGVRGNLASGEITQLRTAIPNVAAATNLDAAAGGANSESMSSFLQRAPRELRHGGRAVTIEDYEDLAVQASPEVERAICIPFHDLATDLEMRRRTSSHVSLIVVPGAEDRKPKPSRALVTTVESYLKKRMSPGATLSIVAPDYIAVSVHTEIMLTDPEYAYDLERIVPEAIARFLHPLTGGANASGWALGKLPNRSDFYPVVGSLPGVDHIRMLAVSVEEERPGLMRTGTFLVCSGTHTVEFVAGRTGRMDSEGGESRAAGA